MAGQGPAVPADQSSSFWDLPTVAGGLNRHADRGRGARLDGSLSGDGDEFDPSTGWTFSGLETDPLLAPVPPAEDAAPVLLATEDELFGPEATGEYGIIAEAADEPAPIRAAGVREPRARGLEIPSHAGAASPLADAARQMRHTLRTSLEIEIEDDDGDEDRITSGHSAVPAPPPRATPPARPTPPPVVARPPPQTDDINTLLAQGRELLAESANADAVLVLRRAQRLQPSNGSVQTWRELAEKRLLLQYCGGVQGTQTPRLRGRPKDYWDRATEMERQLLRALDGKRTVARLMAAAPDDKLVFLLEMLGRFGERGWLTWA